jgi:hypothetical protein
MVAPFDGNHLVVLLVYTILAGIWLGELRWEVRRKSSGCLFDRSFSLDIGNSKRVCRLLLT